MGVQFKHTDLIHTVETIVHRNFLHVITRLPQNTYTWKLYKNSIKRNNIM